jgi:hypothetical protein
MPAGKFQYDASTDRWEDSDQPELGQLTTREVTEGGFYNVGRNVYYQPDPEIGSVLVGRIAAIAGSELTFTKSGVITLENNIRERELNQETLSNALYSGSVTGTFQVPGRDPIEVSSAYVNLAPFGRRLYVPSAGATSKSDYLTLAEGDAAPPGYRAATPQETLGRGAVGFLMRSQRALMAEIAAEGLQLGPGGPISHDDYEVAQYIAANLELAATITYDLSARVGL